MIHLVCWNTRKQQTAWENQRLDQIQYKSTPPTRVRETSPSHFIFAQLQLNFTLLITVFTFVGKVHLKCGKTSNLLQCIVTNLIFCRVSSKLHKSKHFFFFFTQMIQTTALGIKHDVVVQSVQCINNRPFVSILS